MLDIVKTNKVSAVLGIDGGFFNTSCIAVSVGQAMAFISKAYGVIAEKNFQDHKKEYGREVYVSMVITPSNTVYREEWGCPKNGEHTYKLECTRNPEFIKDRYEYIEMATKNILDLKEQLKQCTVLLEYSDLECMYISE